jgi:cytochrome c556
MDGNQTALTDIEDATDADADLAALKAEAYVVYTNLTVAPHLFPSSTRPVIAADGTATPATAAAPAIWDNFAAFYAQFTDAASLAYDMSDVQDLATLRSDEKMLRADCDACHTKNMVTFNPGAPGSAPAASASGTPAASAPQRTAATPAAPPALQPLVPLAPGARPGSDTALALSTDDAAKLKAWITAQKTVSVAVPGTLAVGATLPLLVGLYAIGPAAGVPAAADYEYAVVNNQIVVANFADHKVVYVFG